MSKANANVSPKAPKSVQSNDKATMTKGIARKVVKSNDKATVKSKAGKTKPAQTEPEKTDGRQNAAKPTNTVDKAYERTVKQVPVSVTPVQGRGGNRITVWDHNITGVLRWFGRQGLGVSAAKTFLKAIGLETVIGNATVGCQVYGHLIHGGGKLPELSKDQIKIIKRLAEV